MSGYAGVMQFEFSVSQDVVNKLRGVLLPDCDVEDMMGMSKQQLVMAIIEARNMLNGEE